MLGSIVMGFMADKVGRKPGLFLSGFICTASMLATLLSPVYTMAAVFVFVEGFGLGKKRHMRYNSLLAKALSVVIHDEKIRASVNSRWILLSSIFFSIQGTRLHSGFVHHRPALGLTKTPKIA